MFIYVYMMMTMMLMMMMNWTRQIRGGMFNTCDVPESPNEGPGLK